MSDYIGSIMPVGIGAPVGDITVAGVVISSHIDNLIHLETEHVADTTQNLWLVHNELGRIFKLTSEYDAVDQCFKFRAAKTGIFSTPDSLFGSRFARIAEMVEYSKVVGFCPSSAQDALGKTKIAVRNLERLMRQEYSDLFLIPGQQLDAPEERATEWMQGFWASDSAATPSGMCVFSNEAMAELTPEITIRILAAGLIAEAIATSVRAARISDMATMHPALRLDQNWGFSGKSLYTGLTYYPEARFRGELTERWIRWFELNNTASNDYWDDAKSDSIAVTEASMLGWNPPVQRDAKDRKTIPFDKARADFMATELVKKLNVTHDKWTRDFVQSVERQLDNKRRLSGRQMYLLWQKYKDL